MKWLVRPLVTVPAPYTHKQHSLCFYINLPNSLRSSPPYIIIFYVFHRKGGKRLIVDYLLKKKTYVRIYSAVQQSWRELLLKQSNTALLEKDLELLVIANATVFPRPNLLFLYPPVLCMWYRPDNNNVGSLFKQKGSNWDKALACVADTLHCRHAPMV